MPLSEKARIEVYIPDLPSEAYQALLGRLDHEFTFTFGGCTIDRGLDGSYLSRLGVQMRDRINLIYTDTPVSLATNRDALARYTEQLQQAAFEALEEEAVLVVVIPVFHIE